MPKNKVSDPITDQEIAFARLVLAGAMTDRQAAEAVGLNPDSAAYTKSKPRVRDYMLQHRAAVLQQLIQQEADGLRRLNLDREKVLDRLWEIANLSPEMTRGSITGQVKALSMIVAMQNFIPDPRAVSAEKKPSPAPNQAQIYTAAWLREQKAKTLDPQPDPASQENSPAVPACPGVVGDPPPNPIELSSRLSRRAVEPERSVVKGPAVSPGPIQSTFANPLGPSQAPPVAPYGPGFSFVPDAGGPFVPDIRVPFSIKKNPFVHPR
jgi:hypothetical protein